MSEKSYGGTAHADSMPERADVVVVGGGVVGLCVAYELAAHGREVVVIDRGRVARGSAAGNAGLITPSHMIPIAAPGVLSGVVKGMIRRTGPVTVRPSLDPSYLRWMVRFARHCNSRAAHAGAVALAALGFLSADLAVRWIRREGIDCSYQQSGLLYAYGDQAAFEAVPARGRHHGAVRHHHREIQRRRAPGAGTGAPRGSRRGVPVRGGRRSRPGPVHVGAGGGAGGARGHVRTGDGAARLPHLGRRGGTLGDISGGIGARPGGDRHRRLDPEGVRAAWRVDPHPGRQGLQHDGGRAPPGSSQQHTPGRPVGSGEPDRGPAADERLAGVGSPRHPAVATRLAQVEANVRSRVHLDRELTVLERWAGLRPVTPDGLPIIGRSPGWSNVTYAVGHGKLGLSHGPATGRLVAQIIFDQPTELDLEPFSPHRF